MLEKEGVIRSPDGLRSLIETVYKDDAEVCVPKDLIGSYFDAEGRAGAERGVATTNVNGGAKRDHRGGVKRDHLAAAGLSP